MVNTEGFEESTPFLFDTLDHWGTPGTSIELFIFLEISGNHFLFCIEVSTLAM